MSWSRKIPSLTLCGKAAYFLGLGTLGLWFRLDNRSLLVFGLVLVGGVGVSMLLTWYRMQRIESVVERPETARAMSPSPVQVEVSSERAVRGLVVSDPYRASLGPTVHVERIPRLRPQRMRAHERFNRRGLTRLSPLRMSTARPFGLAVCEVRSGKSSEVLVLPALGELNGELRRLVTVAATDQLRERPTRRVGQGDETLHIRAWQPGESIRRVHWRATARTGRLMSREMDDARTPPLILALGSMPYHPSSSLQVRRFEKAVSMASTMLNLAYKSHREVQLVLPNSPDPILIKRGGRHSLVNAEKQLAQLPQNPGWPNFEALSDDLLSQRGFVIHPGGDESRPLPGLPQGWTYLDTEESERTLRFNPRKASA